MPDENNGEQQALYFPEVVQIIASFGCGQKVDAAIDNLKKYQYGQALETITGELEVDPMLLFAIAAVETEGYPEKTNKLGMFQVAGNPHESDPREQIEYAAEHYKKKAEACGGDNVLGPVTAFKYDNQNIISAAKNSHSMIYGEEWCTLLVSNGISDYDTMAYFGKVCSCYEIARKKITGFSTMDNNTNGGAYSFPFATSTLNKVSIYSDYGVEQTEGGIAKVRNQILFRTEKGLEIGAPCRCTKVGVKKTDSGYIVTFPLNNNDGTLYYYLINSITSTSGVYEALDKGQVFGKTGEYFAMAYKDAAGAFQDPKVIFPSLNGKTSNKKDSLGKQLSDQTVTRTNGDEYDVASEID